MKKKSAADAEGTKPTAARKKIQQKEKLRIFAFNFNFHLENQNTANTSIL